MARRTDVLASYRREYLQTRQAVGEARRTLVAFARTCGFSGQPLDDIEIAVGEALANAFEHGQCDSGGFAVDVRCERDALIAEDSGHGFDHRTKRPLRPSLESLRGFGTFIMRELMDDVEYFDRGTRVRLTNRFPESLSDEFPMLEA